jgi:hypothetical protein
MQSAVQSLHSVLLNRNMQRYSPSAIGTESLGNSGAVDAEVCKASPKVDKASRGMCKARGIIHQNKTDLFRHMSVTFKRFRNSSETKFGQAPRHLDHIEI